jgi:hypothetical protein
MPFVTCLDVALARGARRDENGAITGSEFDRVGIPLFGGCLTCGASIAAYNAYPTTTGYLRCAGCVESAGDGYETVRAFEWENEPGTPVLPEFAEQGVNPVIPVCEYCFLEGHTILDCPTIDPDTLAEARAQREARDEEGRNGDFD